MTMRDARPTQAHSSEWGISEKQYKKRRADFLTSFGDFVDSIVNLILNPNTIFFITIVLAAWIFTLNAVPYMNLFGRKFAKLAATSDHFFVQWDLHLLAAVMGFLTLAVIQFVQISPDLPKFLPSWGKRLLFKLNLFRVAKPYTGENGSSLTPKAYGWVKRSHENAHKAAVVASLLFYAFDIWVCIQTYPVVSSLGDWSIENIFYVALLVRGFHFCLFISSLFNTQRLNSAEAAEFLEQERRLRGSSNRS